MTDQDILNITKIAIPTRCYRGLTGIFRDGSKSFAIPTSCKSWQCDACAGRKRFDMAIAYGNYIAGFRQWCIIVIENWPSLRRRLARGGCKWVKIERLVISDLDAQVGMIDALRKLGEALLAIRRPDMEPGKRFRPCTSTLRMMKKDGYELIGFAGSNDAVIRCLDRYGVEYVIEGRVLRWDNGCLTHAQILGLRSELG